MSETQNQDAPQEVAEQAVSPAPEVADAPVAPAEEKQERLVESALEATHSDALPLSPITTGTPEKAETEGSAKKQSHRGLRRRNTERGKRGNKNTTQSVGVVENPGDVKETLSGKFVDGYERDKESRRARERRSAPTGQREETPAAQGWCMKESGENTNLRRRHPQSNAGGNHAKLIIEPAPIPEQEKDPSFLQKLKMKILTFFGLNKKKKKHDKKRHGRKYRNKHDKKFHGKGSELRKSDRSGKQDFRGGNRRGRHSRGPRPGNSGARPHQNHGANRNQPTTSDKT